MPLTTADNSVCYRLTSQELGVRLEIWECPSGTACSELSFLFRVHYCLPTIAAAQAALEYHLHANGYAPSSVQLVADGATSPLDCRSIAATLPDA
ncbi:MAG: hypothetical protein ICV62_15405 [Cyanobacteria bacterium Co-bin13]|nr:hypothetical protein [Cyanobacteria bacterium Co-bin13]